MKNRKSRNNSGNSAPWFNPALRNNNNQQSQCRRFNNQRLQVNQPPTPLQQPTVIQQPTIQIDPPQPPITVPTEEVPFWCVLDTPEKQSAFERNRTFLPPPNSLLDSFPMDRFTEAITEYTNLLRDRMRLPRLQSDLLLISAAQFKANEMAQEQYFDHTNPTGRTFTQLADRFGVSNSCGRGEIIHYGPPTPYDAFVGFFCSPDHFANMTNPRFTKIGFGFATGEPYETINDFTLLNYKWAGWFSC